MPDPLRSARKTAAARHGALHRHCFTVHVALFTTLRHMVDGLNTRPNKAPAPNLRPRFPLGKLGCFVCPFCAPPASSAAVGEARRWAEAKALL
jgi:hypothetical protein